MVQRKQNSLTENFLDSLIEDNQIDKAEEEIILEVKQSPKVNDDE